ncbi:phospho-acceptor domain-containing protein [Novosphingobium kunmingense]|uniref:histidine kinase n=1 Tax=Novosphingobium kunmingense TaxID=1211806 RepID=A0A2N0I1Q4_9SPHN|nr:histidine kinase dimerization/phospho-acceptor domain-containing protein [Novosphingobium kunmingense]PKB25100.1 phospho-acceptor domain-containing protein [Novosphingobium kunmingense]
MHFDDRLGTVLRLRADGPAVRRIQFRQLLDLLGTMPSEARGEQVDSAFDRLVQLAATIPVTDRVAMIRDQGLRMRSPRLVAALAADDSIIAVAALDRAELTEDEWLDLIPALPLAARGYVRRRRDLSFAVEAQLARLGIRERGLPPAGAGEAAAALELDQSAALEPDDGYEAEIASNVTPLIRPPRPAPVPAEGNADEGIGAIVRKIEAYRKSRQAGEPSGASDAPRLPLGEDPVLHAPSRLRAFDFATDAAGRIIWSDPGTAPMMIGQSLSALRAEPRGALRDALRARQPLRAIPVALEGAPAIAGNWQIDAAPWFDTLTGRHLGWRGRMRRPAETPPAAAAPAVKPDSQSDRIRQMLHELRTPVNAIQGFAEVIQQQLFGPTPHEYRALAATIAGDAARMLAAFEELERLAKLDSGALELDEGETDLADVVEATVAQLAAHTRHRSSGFAVKVPPRPLPVGLARIEVERLVWRLLATLAGVAGPGEVLKLKLQSRESGIRLDVALPAALASRDEQALFETAAGSVPQVIAAGVFGIGFALRLVAAEARAAGGRLIHKGDRLRLVLPGLTLSPPHHSDGRAVTVVRDEADSNTGT